MAKTEETPALQRVSRDRPQRKKASRYCIDFACDKLCMAAMDHEHERRNTQHALIRARPVREKGKFVKVSELCPVPSTTNRVVSHVFLQKRRSRRRRCARDPVVHGGAFQGNRRAGRRRGNSRRGPCCERFRRPRQLCVCVCVCVSRAGGREKRKSREKNIITRHVSEREFDR